MLPNDIQTWLFFFDDKLLYHMRQQNGLLRIILKNFKQGVLKMQASENLFLSSHAIASEPRITSIASHKDFITSSLHLTSTKHS